MTQRKLFAGKEYFSQCIDWFPSVVYVFLMPSTSLISIKNFAPEDVQLLFSQVEKKVHQNKAQSPKVGALLFFEPSTRTRMSFEIACGQLGFPLSVLSSAHGTSLQKGESVLDTILNVTAMGPDFLVIRCGDDVNLEEINQMISVPIVNAGWGTQGHPTQALLDTYTLYSKFKKLKGLKVLVVGDVKHSRVASSNFELFDLLGIEWAVCAPDYFLSEQFSKKYSGKKFESLQEALKWSDATMALRCQFERHGEIQMDQKDYQGRYQLNAKTLKDYQGVILHPGPINHGIELDFDTWNDSRSMIFEQVKNGVLIRQAIISGLFGKG
jgi:aspartate carbamoyltransferase catalytic subunit